MKTLLADLWFVEVSGDAGAVVDDLTSYLRAHGEGGCTLETFGCVLPAHVALRGGERAAELLAIHPQVKSVVISHSRMNVYRVEVSDARVWKRIQMAAEENLLDQEIINRGACGAAARYLQTSQRVVRMIGKINGVLSVSKVAQ